MKFAPKKGVNLRADGFNNYEQFILMQNMDYTDRELYEQIKGSVKYHGTVLDNAEPTAIWVNYNEIENIQDVMVAISDKIYKKNFGSNEFTELYSGFTPGKIRFPVNLRSKSYIPHPVDGLYEFDGVSKITKVSQIQLKDMIVVKETNRCFAITANNELVWTDDLVIIGGVPIEWNALNIDLLPPTEGDVPEKIWFLNGRLVILMTHSIWIYYVNGSPTNWRPEKIATVVGCIAPKTARQIGAELWFLGYSPQTSVGLYGFNGSSVRLLSYDISRFLKRINPDYIFEAASEYSDNLYKLSIPIDSSIVNNYTFHFDTILVNEDTGAPCIYGPHTYGFSCSCTLNTRKFHGEHLFGRKASDGGRIYRVADYKTQYSSELVDDGNLIQTILLSSIIDTEQIEKAVYDNSWIKKYQHIYLEHHPIGRGSCHVEIYKGHENEVSYAYDQYLEGNNFPLETISLDNNALDFDGSETSGHINDFNSDAIQIKVTNSDKNNKMVFKSLSYDAKPDRRKKYVQQVRI